MTYALHLGDCLEVMRGMSDNSIDAVVTDPPYELGFMGKSWDNTGIAYQVGMWCEVLRILKPGGHLLSFGGSRTYHRMACAIEDAGFEIRDQLQWIYGSGFPKSLNIGKQDGCEYWQGYGTALKPAHEPICMARKPFKGTVANNVLAYGTGGINIDGCRVGTTDETRRAKGGWQDNGYVGGKYDNEKYNAFDARPAQSRFPANILHDGSDEVVGMFPQCKQANDVSEFKQLESMRFSAGGEGVKPQKQTNGKIITASAARFFYCAKASRSERNAGLEGMDKKFIATMSDGIGNREHNENEPNAWAQNHHPTVKPISVMRWLVRLITPPNGTVLDPFTGSGTTGIAAVLEGFDFIGIEREAEYHEIARRRIEHWMKQASLRLPLEVA